MIKIVAVGNSFSQDAITYLEKICEADGIDVYVRNIYIGGCSLETHFNNLTSDTVYDYQAPGEYEGKTVTLKEGLTLENWDVVTFQQCSALSGKSDTYFPYLNALSEYVKDIQPKAKQYIHKTWAYETDFVSANFDSYNRDQKLMYNELTDAYSAAAKAIGAPIIPSGDVIQTLRTKTPFDYQNGGLSLCRDGFHMSLDYGRYAAGATWYETILGGDIRTNTYAPEGTEPALIKLIRETVHEICHK